jgi:hypothetical protein
MRDQYFGWHEWLGLLKVVFLQALPLPVFLFGAAAGRFPWSSVTAGALVAFRLGILAGTARAYPSRPWSYWLSPLLDFPVALKLIVSALARRHVWRGQIYLRRPDSGFGAAQNQSPAAGEAPDGSRPA